eukprot:PLAT11048.1.p1 GENE.PLAT11048.1~~PLAT11048.1.p1  ORF type:complete len:310 (-),score=129.64 PLAT11048.1:128-1057(-)
MAGSPALYIVSRCNIFLASLTATLLVVLSLSSVSFEEYALNYNWVAEKVELGHVYAPGIYFIGVGHHFLKYPKTLQSVDFNKLHMRTSDGLSVTLDISFQYALQRENVSSLYETFDYHGRKEDGYSAVFSDMAIDLLTESATHYTAYEMFNDRDTIQVGMQQSLNQVFSSDLFATVPYFQLKSVTLPSQFEAAIQEAEVARQDISKASYEAENVQVEMATQVAEASFEGTVLVRKAEAEAEQTRLRGMAAANSSIAEIDSEALALATVQSALGLDGDGVLSWLYSQVFLQQKGSQLVVGQFPTETTLEL